MVRTRVGYAGGTLVNPTYHRLGDHTESIEVDYDPEVISYEDLLAVFWSSHSPTSRPWSRQYASLILTHDDTQRRLAEESLRREEERRGRKTVVEVEISALGEIRARGEVVAVPMPTTMKPA